jgi:hypothetical protein
MAQADQTIQNNTFPAVRADINNNLAALFTNSSGATAPTVTVAYQDWIDTSGVDPVWKKRNAANNAWITLGTIIGNAIAFEGTLPDQSGNAGEYLKTDGTNATWEPIVSGINAADVFASSGTWTCPAGVTQVLAAVAGGGGGGSGGNSNLSRTGGAGGLGIGLLSVSPGSVYTVTVGAGGAGSNGSSDAGGSSTFMTITSTGGAGATSAASGASGTCTSADANLRRGINTGGSSYDIFTGANVRPREESVGSISWERDSAYCPGARGSGVSNSSSGGVGGAVLLLY